VFDQVFDQLLRRRVSFNAYTYNCLLQLCASAGRMDDALAVYNLQVRCVGPFVDLLGVFLLLCVLYSVSV
jgi:pentatricopeptide repeat protein